VGEDKEEGKNSDYELNQENTNTDYSGVFNENCCSKVIQKKTRK